MLFSKGNRKLPNTTLIWNLPSGKTCPGATKECKVYCYAKKAELLYPQVLPFRERNYQLSLQQGTFIHAVIDELIKTKNWDTVRIFESGDFYDLNHLNNWEMITSAFPDKIFYAYTKVWYSYHNYNKKPKNMILLYSDDKKIINIKELKNIGYDGRARIDDGRKLTKKEFMCPGSCKTCHYCHDGKEFKQVVFKRH